MGAPLSIRFDPSVLERLRRRARTTPGATPSGLVQRLVDEGLRMDDHPGIVFKDGPAGRRAALALGPDVWEIVTVARGIDKRGTKAVAAIGEAMNLAAWQVNVALDYYGSYPEEIDEEIAAREAAARTAEAAWTTRQQLLA